jgi:hypothetical protein
MTEYTFQLNVKLGKGYDAHLVNVTGIGAADFKENLQWVTENAAGIVSAATALEAAYGVKVLAPQVASTQVTNTQPQQQQAPGQWADRPYANPGTQQPQQAYQPPAVQQAPPNPGPVPSCQHGAMVLRPAGIAAGTGKAYKAFYSCTAGRDSGCRSVNA